MMANAKIRKGCSCSMFGVVETGLGDNNRPIIQVFGPDALVRYSNREPDEEMDDIDMVCIRCGATAEWEIVCRG